MGVGGGDRAEARPHLGDDRRVLGRGASRVVAQRVLEEGIGLRRQQDALGKLGRMRHVEHMRAVTPYYLIGGRWDKRIYDTIEKGQDFNPHIYERDE